MKNTYRSMNASQLITLAGQVTAAVGPIPTIYGTTAGVVTAITSQTELLLEAETVYEAQKVALTAAKEDRDTQQAALVSQVAALARTIYAKQGLTNAQIAATGLAVHDSVPSPSGVSTPSDFNAVPSADGQCKMKWNRNGNGAGTTFIIQSSADGEAWATIFTTTKASSTLGYFAPGEIRYFRVLAQRGGEVSWPSETVGIYLPTTSTVNLLLAA